MYIFFEFKYLNDNFFLGVLPAPIHSLEHGPGGQNGWKQIKLFALWKPYILAAVHLYPTNQLLVEYPKTPPPPPFPFSPGEKGKFLFSKTIVEYHTFFMFFFVKIAFKLQAPFPIERLKRTLLHTQHILIVAGDFSQNICIGSKLYVKRYETGFSFI